MKSLIAALHQHVFRLKYALRARNWRGNHPMAAPTPPRFLVSGFINEAFGIGRAARLTIDALRARGHAVMSHDLRPAQRGLLTRAPAPIPVGDSNIWLIHANPPEARIALFAHDEAQWRDLYRIGYWAWESDLAPTGWLDVAQHFHEIWVPSAFVRAAFARAFAENNLSLQTAKLKIVPHPVAVPAIVETRFERGRVRVLTMYDPKSGLDRKNPAGAISAWIEAFPNPSENAELIVKSLLDNASLNTLAGNRPDIVFVSQTLSDADQQILLQSCDILLSLHRAEGFGLPLAEAMAAGLAVIATEGTGNGDFMTVDNSILIPGHPVPASIMYNGPHAQWMEPDIALAAQALRLLVHDAVRRHALGDRAHADMRQAYKQWRFD